jgi:acetolactate synthase I/II/III large subunit
VNFGEQLCDELVDLGYTHCLFLAGGNVMHLVEACRTRFRMVPVVHEVSAVIGAEFFNETSLDGGKAFAVVTAGPGLTNAMTGIAGAWLESREVLVLGGQVKSADLARNGIRQMGIQELDGVSIATPITKASVRVEHPIPMTLFRELVESGRSGRPGPVFLEICLDAQAAPVDGVVAPARDAARIPRPPGSAPPAWNEAMEQLSMAARPLVLLGGGVSRTAARTLRGQLESLGIPVAVTWNAFDRLPSDSPVYAGRPNTWGMRWANLAIQQCDFLVAVGTRLGLQQTGFAWEEFAPRARIVHVDIDQAELDKGRPHVDWKVRWDADAALEDLVTRSTGDVRWSAWLSFVRELRENLPVVEESNTSDGPDLVPQQFIAELSDAMGHSDILIPSSSGGAFTVAMQVFANKEGQLVVGDKGLASMGYGLAGAIGAALANPERRVVLTEGDGGFAQNLQELGTVAVNHLRLKMFVMSNQGYASIRMTQRNYYGGAYVGCDRSSGLGLPDWERIASAWGIPFARLDRAWTSDAIVTELLESDGPALFEVPISQEQTYWPKIGSRVLPDGSMASAPLHLMSPPLPEELATHCLPYLTEGEPA